MSFKTAVMGKIGRQVLLAQKHSPKILFIAGVAGVVTTVVLASRATLKVENVLIEHEERKDKIVLASSVVEGYSEADASQDLIITYARTIANIAKLYAPAILVGVASVAALTGSHVILTNRIGNLGAAYAVLDKGFREYRKRVVDELGEQKDAEFRYGAEEAQVIDETEEGPVVKDVKRPSHGRSIYARWFDEGSTQWSRSDMANQTFLRCQQNYANDMLRAYGHLFLNDVYKMLGLQPSPEGQLVGWVLDNPNGGDNYISFGVFSNDFYIAQQFVNGDTRSVLLDFNVDGVVYDLIGKKDK